MQTSCGVLLLNELDEVFVAHATGQRHWDLPKGARDAQESDLEAALRELAEETAIALDESELTPLGLFAYRPGKQLSLFWRKCPSHVSTRHSANARALSWIFAIESCRKLTILRGLLGKNYPITAPRACALSWNGPKRSFGVSSLAQPIPGA